MIMEINRNNFDHFYQLYLEGSLDPLGTAELMLFLSRNPDIEESLNSALSVSDGSIYLSNKARLRKSYSDIAEISENNFDEFCIARLENLLSPEDNKRLEDYLEMHPEKSSDAALIRRLKLSPVAEIKFTGKASLKKALPLSPWTKLLVPLAIAASVIFLVVFFVTEPDQTVISPVITAMPEAPAGDANEPVIAVRIPEQVSPQANNTSGTAGYMDENVIQEFSRDNYLLSSIEPININKLLPVENSGVLKDGLRNDYFASSPVNTQENERQGLFRDIDLWETTVFAVKGFNILTESNLSVGRTTEEDGRTRISLDSDGKTIIAARVKNNRL